MKKILVIGCPGSGKSTFSKRLSKVLNLPILHIDRIFHIDNTTTITKSELKAKIKDFIDKTDEYIIDGNYTGSLEYRLQYADTIFYFDIPVETCLKNVIKRCKSGEVRSDMAPGFDNSIMDDDFLEYVETFNQRVKPRIDFILSNQNIPTIKFNTYEDVEKFFNNLNQY